MRKKYSTDLTDKHREEIKPLLTGMRNRKWSKRDLIDAVFYLVDSGCKWRQLPHDFPPAFTIPGFYRRAKRKTFIAQVEEYLRLEVEISQKITPHGWQIMSPRPDS